MQNPKIPVCIFRRFHFAKSEDCSLHFPNFDSARCRQANARNILVQLHAQKTPVGTRRKSGVAKTGGLVPSEGIWVRHFCASGCGVFRNYQTATLVSPGVFQLSEKSSITYTAARGRFSPRADVVPQPEAVFARAHIGPQPEAAFCQNRRRPAARGRFLPGPEPSRNQRTLLSLLTQLRPIEQNCHCGN